MIAIIETSYNTSGGTLASASVHELRRAAGADEISRTELAGRIGISRQTVSNHGYPLWWETAPRAVRTFLESEDWEGRTIVTFATSGSNTRGADGVQLHDSAPAAHWVPGRRVGANESEAKLAKWIEGLAL